MADLGVPRFIPEPGVDSGNDAEAIAAGAKAIAGVASDYIVSKETNALQDSLAETAEAGLSAVEEGPEEELGHVFTSTKEQELYDNLKRMQGQINQASGGVKAAVINRAKRLTTQAMKDNPSIRDTLASQFREFVTLNPDLDALDLADASFTADAALAQKQRDTIYNNAYGDVKDGGLGIPAEVPFGSPRFVQMYTQASALEAETNANLLFLNTLESQDRIDVREIGPSIQKALEGKANAIDATFKQDNAQLAEVRLAANRLAQGKGSAEDDTLVASWGIEGGLREEKVQKYNVYINELEGLKAKIPIAQRDTPYGKELLATIDSNINYATRWRDAVSSLATQPQLSELMEIESSIRTQQWNRRFPRARQLSEDIQRMDRVLEHSDVLGLDDVLFKDDLGNIVLPTLQETLINSYLFGTSALNGNETSPEEVRSRIHRNVNTGDDPYGAIDNADRGTQALSNLVATNGRMAQVYDTYDKVGETDRAPVYGMMAANTAHLYELRTGQQYAPSTVAKVSEIYAHPAQMDMVSKIRKAEDVPAEAVTIAALGEELTTYLVEMPNNGVNGLINGYYTELNTRYGGKSLNEYITVDMSKIEDGKVQIKLKPNAAKELAQQEAESRPGSRFSAVGASPSDVARKQQELQNAVNRLSKGVNNTLGVVTAADFYKDSEAEEPAYALAWENYGFNRLFELGAE